MGYDAERTEDELVPNHGEIDINLLSKDTRAVLMLFAQAMRTEPGILRAQVTFDDLQGDLEGLDAPPRVHVILTPDGNPRYWLPT